MQGELDKIVAQLARVAGLATLGQARPATRAGRRTSSCPATPTARPSRSSRANDETGGPNWRLLDANPIVDKLRAKKQAAETGNVSATMSKALGPEGLALLARLITLWGDPPEARLSPQPGGYHASRSAWASRP